MNSPLISEPSILLPFNKVFELSFGILNITGVFLGRWCSLYRTIPLALGEGAFGMLHGAVEFCEPTGWYF